jgi:uncharacterized protein YjbJ (UPF0337 family)
MGFLDKLLGRSKKAAGEMMDKPEMKREGMHQEAEGKAEERAKTAESTAQDAREQAAEHHAEREGS